MDLKEKIIYLTNRYYDEIVQIRRYIHKNPELSYYENETSAFIEKMLQEYGINYKKGFVNTGIIAWLQGEKPGPVIGLRAELDALPITENNQVSYKSKRNGIMHACGHDAHLAMLLGTMKILKELKKDFPGTVLFIFQPAEELVPGGAKLMIKDGAFDEIKPDLIIAQHVYPDLEAGKVGYKAGEYMASSDEIYITIHGKGGHAAIPGKRDDTILAAARLLILLYEKINAPLPGKPPTILAFGKIDGAGATNVIPSEVKIAGTFRTFDEKWRKAAHRQMKKIIAEFERKESIGVKFNIKKGYPVLRNDLKITKSAIRLSGAFLGKKNVVSLEQRMTSEDFANYSHSCPVCFFRLGTGIKGKESALHTSDFNIDENALATGMGNLSWLACSLLKEMSE